MNLKELRKLAEAATPGPWEKVGDGIDGGKVGCETVIDVEDLPAAQYPEMQSGEMVGDNLINDLEYIAAMNPATTLKLLGALEALEFYASAPQSTHNTEPGVNAGEMQPLGTRAREALAALKK